MDYMPANMSEVSKVSDSYGFDIDMLFSGFVHEYTQTGTILRVSSVLVTINLQLGEREKCMHLVRLGRQRHIASPVISSWVCNIPISFKCQ